MVVLRAVVSLPDREGMLKFGHRRPSSIPCILLSHGGRCGRDSGRNDSLRCDTYPPLIISMEVGQLLLTGCQYYSTLYDGIVLCTPRRLELLLARNKAIDNPHSWG